MRFTRPSECLLILFIFVYLSVLKSSCKRNKNIQTDSVWQIGDAWSPAGKAPPTWKRWSKGDGTWGTAAWKLGTPVQLPAAQQRPSNRWIWHGRRRCRRARLALFFRRQQSWCVVAPWLGCREVKIMPSAASLQALPVLFLAVAGFTGAEMVKAAGTDDSGVLLRDGTLHL
jgi:hypothetical protein